MEFHRFEPRSWPGRLLHGLVMAGMFAFAAAAHAQKSFSTPEAAMSAFGEAVERDQEQMLQAIFGSDFRKLIPPADAGVRQTFEEEWARAHAVKQVNASRAEITVGDAGWTLPIPLVKAGQGWHFDTRAGAEEMRLRRIGRNELSVIKTMLAIYDAQREYAQTDHDGQGVLVYASKIVSSPGKHDGLYWPTEPGQPPSPLGPAFLDASARDAASAGYHGYRYRLLNSQGPHAPGGAYSYVARGKLFGGFAIIAWPVAYGETGVMTFMVSHAGQVYERDLGPQSADRAQKMGSFDPGPEWSRVADDDID
ncbi:hypothetical protein CAL15_07245 [Bordetella genomosp. 13]|uniref:DUF2950 domain-containing protein n=2 Tax=Bordetella genomosp. 13 TaxID=463040 RepID=A0A1W6ZBH3_9BORD|nr:hypothetical protein CAL15_07245 [Bordetella genomosp. 13]